MNNFISTIVLIDSVAPVIGELKIKKRDPSLSEFLIPNRKGEGFSHFTASSLKLFVSGLQYAIKIISDSNEIKKIRVNNVEIFFDPNNGLKIIDPLTTGRIHITRIENKESGLKTLKHFYDKLTVVLKAFEILESNLTLDRNLFNNENNGKVKLIAPDVFNGPGRAFYTSIRRNKDFFTLGFKESKIYFYTANNDDMDFARKIIDLFKGVKENREGVIFHWDRQPDLCRFVSVVKHTHLNIEEKERVVWYIHLNSNHLIGHYNDKISFSIEDENLDHFVDDLNVAISRNL